MIKKNTQNTAKVATFTLHTRYGYEHIGLRENHNDSTKVPFPGLVLVSIRVSQIKQFTRSESHPAYKEANALLSWLENSITTSFEKLRFHEIKTTEIINKDKQILYQFADEKWEQKYTIPCKSRVVWRGIRLLIFYDSIVKNYLTLWKTASIEKDECFSSIKECSTVLRALFSAFNIEAKKLIYAYKETSILNTVS